MEVPTPLMRGEDIVYSPNKYREYKPRVQKGCGIDLSKLAPYGAEVRNQANKTTGAVSFMEGYSKVTEEIGAEGRRGALMISLDCHHPDLIDFINIKTKEGVVTKANISVRVTDDFMQAVENDKDWVMSFTRPETGETITKTARAKDIFHQICQNNSDWAEPGILYWDRIENWNLLSEDPNFHYAGTNPCAEEPLPAGGSCLLGSINLSEFVENKQFNFDSFRNAVSIAVKALNEVLDEGLPLHPLAEQRESVRDWRQIGLGVMGIADMLIKMELPYDSDKAIEFCNKVAFVMADMALFTSAMLAKSYGVYPKYEKHILKSNYFDFNTDGTTKFKVEKYGLRNSQLLTIAPTGTLSTMFGISGGIEPIYANSYTRKTESLHGKDVYYKVYTPIVDQYMKKHGLTEESQLPEWFVTSSTIDPMKRIAMQAVWQSHIDASISSTVNLPNEATVEDIERLYMEAWKQGLKGLTIYRDGCKRSGVLSHEDKTVAPQNQAEAFVGLARGDIVECSNDLIGKKRKLTTGCGSLHVLAYFDPVTGEMQEVYLNKGSTGGCANFMTGLSRTLSLLCRAGVDVRTIKDQLDSTGACPSYATRSATKHDTSKGSCCPMAIGNALVEMWEEMQDEIDETWEENQCGQATQSKKEVNQQTKQIDTNNSVICPECGEPLVFEGGCNSCKNCGYSKCN